MIKSDSIMNLAKALAAAQSVIGHAHKDSNNPFFKSKYADLASVWDACRKPLTDNGLSVTQLLSNDGPKIICTTILMHESGEFIGSDFFMLPKDDTPQAGGSCATYLRRYALQSIVGIAPDDDDGSAASGRGNNYAQTDYSKKTTPSPMAAPSGQGNSYAASATQGKFDPSNEAHKSSALGFLEKKKQAPLLKQFLVVMAGKPATTASLNEAWNLINPESPDQPKE